MASENKTVDEILTEIRKEYPPKYCSSKSCRIEVKQPIRELADNIEVAHKRELEEKQAQIDDGMRKFNEIDNMLQEERAKVAKLRECLKEAIKKQCKHKECKNNVCFFVELGMEDECVVYKWRNALEGAKDE